MNKMFKFVLVLIIALISINRTVLSLLEFLSCVLVPLGAVLMALAAKRFYSEKKYISILSQISMLTGLAVSVWYGIEYIYYGTMVQGGYRVFMLPTMYGLILSILFDQIASKKTKVLE